MILDNNQPVISCSSGLVRCLEARYDSLVVVRHIWDLVLLSGVVLEAGDVLEGQAERVRHEHQRLVHSLRDHDQVEVLIRMSRNCKIDQPIKWSESKHYDVETA